MLAEVSRAGEFEVPSYCTKHGRFQRLSSPHSANPGASESFVGLKGPLRGLIGGGPEKERSGVELWLVAEPHRGFSSAPIWHWGPSGSSAGFGWVAPAVDRGTTSHVLQGRQPRRARALGRPRRPARPFRKPHPCRICLSRSRPSLLGNRRNSKRVLCSGFSALRAGLRNSRISAPRSHVTSSCPTPDHLGTQAASYP